ncbi:BolA/IbaG family iron-sulfur metabolism protein [Buchnera aphidicola]|uniref:BolA/IbaG family iron-sulfur metabolism protein n=1 Tax=Buchnera aphidicola TaxID=9 RepID=UPI002238AB45|nr:BolA/IbaG family iron-sulfur metabolism protein [Buchnera aphidicola]MCW5197576.1 BolA/IbaG family iron-sulfur metabolism protein [Buchnera aphidicola (Chaitophorus viminalis)]
MKNKIKKILNNKLKLKYIKIIKNNNYYKILAVGDIFLKMNMVDRQKIIYSPLISYIQENKIHAISIKAYSNKEWRKIQK